MFRTSRKAKAENSLPVTSPPSPSAVAHSPAKAGIAVNEFYAWYLEKQMGEGLKPNWYLTSDKLTPEFRQAWQKLQAEAEKNGGEGLDYDPVVNAQEIPPGGFRAAHAEAGAEPGTVRVLVVAVGWDHSLEVRMKKRGPIGKWQVDAIQDLNQDLETLKPMNITDKARCRAVAEGFLATMRSRAVDRAWWVLSPKQREQFPPENLRSFFQEMNALNPRGSAEVKEWDPGEGMIGMEADLKAPGKQDDFVAFLFTKDASNGWLIDSFVLQ